MEYRVFGKSRDEQTIQPRRAAYVVVKEDGLVAAVKNGSKYFLPGGGSESSESVIETVIREVAEELQCEIYIDHEIGEAVQYFYSDDDQVYYRMEATFFAGQFASEPGGEICWVSELILKDELFHE